MIRLVLRVLLLSLVSMGLFAGCGPEKSSTELRDDTRDEERDANTKLEKEELQRRADLRWPVVLRAEGTFESSYRADGRTIRVLLKVVPVVFEVPLKNSNETFEMPTLQATFTQRSSGVSTRLNTTDFVEASGEVFMKNTTSQRGIELRFKVREDGDLAGRIFIPIFPLDEPIVFKRVRE